MNASSANAVSLNELSTPPKSSSSKKKLLDDSSDRNLVVILGELCADPVVIDVQGEPITTFEVRVRRGGRSTLVPVRSTSAQPDLVAGQRVGVLGVVARRFFRVATTTQSRTDVVAERVEILKSNVGVTRLLEHARACLE